MASNIPVIVQGNSFSLAIPLQIYYINGDQMDLEDYTPDPTDEVSVQLKGSRRNYTYTPTIDGNVANIDLSGNELADNYSVVVSIVKANGQRLRSFRTDQFFIVESSDDLTQDDIIAGLEENVIYLNAQAFIAGADGRGIEGIQKTGTSGLVDTYTIYYTDNTTSTFQVTNGANGQAGAQGVGITSIEKTGTSGLVDTYTITLSNGQTSTFEVTNGQDGHDLGLASIINNLDSDSTEDALSAAMGKELGKLVEYENIVDLFAYNIEQALPNPSHKWIKNNNNYQYYSRFIPIPSGTDKIVIKANNDHSCVYALLPTNTSAANATVIYATGTTRMVLDVGDTVELTTLPVDALWLLVEDCLATKDSGGSDPHHSLPLEVKFVSCLPNTMTGNTNNGDFDLKDGNGNVILRLTDGHVKTKNFDSSNIDINVPNFMLDKFNGKKVAIIGDSISTYSGWLPSDVAGYSGTAYATYYPHGNVDNANKTWWYKAMQLLGIDLANVNNCSWSGSRVTGNSSSTTSASAGCSTKRITDLAVRGFTPDIVLVFIGCNDWGNEVGVGTWAVTDSVPSDSSNVATFREAYALMLNKIHVTYPSARVFCFTILDDYKRDEIAGYPPENGNGVVTYQWNENIKEIAEAFGCDVIDIHNCGLTYSNMQSYCVDEGLHPNADGMEMMARKVASELVAKY